MSAKIMGRVWDLDLPANKRMVLLAMADHADHDGNNIFPSMDLIAWKTGYDVRQLRRIVHDLVDDGILVMETPWRHHRPAVYRIDFDAARFKPSFQRRQDVTPERGQDVTPERGQDVTPERGQGGHFSTSGRTFQHIREDISAHATPRLEAPGAATRAPNRPYNRPYNHGVVSTALVISEGAPPDSIEDHADRLLGPITPDNSMRYMSDRQAVIASLYAGADDAACLALLAERADDPSKKRRRSWM